MTIRLARMAGRTLVIVAILATTAIAIGMLPAVTSAAESSVSLESLPQDSIFRLDATLTDQHGKQTSLRALRGRPALITMFYSSCQAICPTLAFTMRRMDAALTPAQRKQIRLAMISFDPAHDTPEALTEFARLNKLEDPRWLLGAPPEDAVRDIAAVLNIRYRPLPNGVFSHSATIILLDSSGVIRARTETLKELDPQFMQALRSML